VKPIRPTGPRTESPVGIYTVRPGEMVATSSIDPEDHIPVSGDDEIEKKKPGSITYYSINRETGEVILVKPSDSSSSNSNSSGSTKRKTKRARKHTK
jgi:hypothetical protein